ncbi:hypothetical protein FJ250_02335 [bacterium]|nr:hypothetical protein [bacterium]
MRRVFGLMDTATARRLARPLTVLALALYAATSALDFVHGTIRLLAIRFSRELNLLEFLRHVADKQPLLNVVLVNTVLVVLPLLLLLAALLAAWLPPRAQPAPLRATIRWLRWRGWMIAALGIVFVLGLRAAASATGGPQLKLLPGGWCFCVALGVAALSLSAAAPQRGEGETRRRAAAAGSAA